ncbi:calcium-binding protein (plasmid) [Nostoc sp. UHCC 0926]|uniref:calcium-binding protein n=1 Tax=Nostoc sp. UHCC 0926 TaxID=3025190 RepID=UPI002362C647|nr:calcium-binding protein [Nostoc sp. UHCC 0926]WDD36971.1 calcium-binding protein [Nostoc sp. UHCC 0926]
MRAEFSTGDNLLSGGDGNDYLSISGYIINISGGDNFYPSSGNNTLNGGTGDDILYAQISTGNNLLSGGDGNDSFYVSTSSPYTVLVTQTVDGGKGDDLLSVDYSNATGGITTTFNATTNKGEITAGMYRVSYKNIEGLDIFGTAYDDNIVGSNGNDTLSISSGGKDTVDGGKGDDLLSVDYSVATGGITTTFNVTTNKGEITAGMYRVSYKNIERLNISGTEYDDYIVGNNGNDTLSTRSGGKDTIIGGAGNDRLSADYSSGNNTLNGGAGNDRLSADYSGGNNTLNGGAGDDYLSTNASSGNNLLFGDDGNDILIGGNSNDSLYGGAGTDTFVFNKIFNYGSVDKIYDFNATNEVIQISATGFGGGLSIGSLQKNQFTLGTSATTSEERFIYNSATGALYFDRDGSASEFTQVQFAQLSTGLALTNNNFMVV